MGFDIKKSQWRDLNSWPLPYQGNALPLSYIGGKMSERPGSNRRPSAWKADALPTELLSHWFASFCGESRIRTCEGKTNRFTVCPRWPLEYLPQRCNMIMNVPFFEPMEGLEPTTCWLQISCSSQLSYICFWCKKTTRFFKRIANV